MLWLRENHIQEKTVDLGGNTFSTNGLMRCCYNGFGRSSAVKSYLPFNKLKAKLTDLSIARHPLTDLSIARHPLTVDHHRLLFEDFVELKPDTEVTFLISRMNHFFQDKGTKNCLMLSLQLILWSPEL